MALEKLSSEVQTQILFKDLNLTGLTPRKVVRELQLNEDNASGLKKAKDSQKTTRFVYQLLEGKKKPQQFETLFSLFPHDPFWRSIKSNAVLPTAAD